MLQLEPFTEDLGRPTVRPPLKGRGVEARAHHFPCAFWVSHTHRLARISDSLVRVSRRVGWGAHGPLPEARPCPEGHAGKERAHIPGRAGS